MTPMRADSLRIWENLADDINSTETFRIVSLLHVVQDRSEPFGEPVLSTAEGLRTGSLKGLSAAVSRDAERSEA